jgi:hypothetical protein
VLALGALRVHQFSHFIVFSDHWALRAFSGFAALEPFRQLCELAIVLLLLGLAVLATGFSDGVFLRHAVLDLLASQGGDRRA